MGKLRFKQGTISRNGKTADVIVDSTGYGVSGVPLVLGLGAIALGVGGLMNAAFKSGSNATVRGIKDALNETGDDGYTL